MLEGADCSNYDQRNTFLNSSIGPLEIIQSTISLHQRLLIQNSHPCPWRFGNGFADEVKGGVQHQRHIDDFLQSAKYRSVANIL